MPYDPITQDNYAAKAAEMNAYLIQPPLDSKAAVIEKI